MEEKIRARIAGILAGAAECQSKTEIIDEMCANLTEKYEDLVSGGMPEAEAYTAVIDSIGDVSEIVAFINSGVGTQESSTFDFGAAFDGFEKRMRELAHDLETPMKAVAKDIKTAAMNAKDPIKDMGRGFKNAFKDIGVSCKGNEYRYDYTVPSEGICGVAVSMRSGDVTFGLSEDQNIYVVEKSRSQLEDSKRLSINVNPDGILAIQQANNGASVVFFGLGIMASNVEIFLPQKLLTVLSVETASGEVHVGADINAEELRIKTVSGDINFDASLQCVNAEIKTTSGDLVCRSIDINQFTFISVSGDVCISGNIGSSVIKTTSGDLELSGAIQCIDIKTISGDIDARLSNMPQEMRIVTTSGDSKLIIPENEGFSIQYKKISGDLRSDFNLMTSLSSREGTAIYRNGDLHVYSVQTVSGDMRIMRR